MSEVLARDDEGESLFDTVLDEGCLLLSQVAAKSHFAMKVCGVPRLRHRAVEKIRI